ncbi:MULTISPECIES: DNA mismatch repair protein MutS [unclassified Granulicatella]|uniref:DNA mismatch repair protein MutS n=1 Tax=unclassified Granulicatella TaxID=2630493 RepID=UPI001072F802|nr:MULTISPECIES: DNA mismatch repair protein MutS [unclassified Granulicatella]MBF0779812.1 DNA mismatch repair protein MutS [Granulicatella sp. 19428wC4_WM01]TFU96113.1 DNA mismatch repair protein MutS [Granulicatella sp. WM01]
MSETVTPMMKQYFSIKENYKDCLLFYRLGDFYELFYEDAKIASEVLEITLTSRNKNSAHAVPMCGVPHHSSSEYIKTLVDKGYKIAICEQLEDAKMTKGMVKRDVVQVITPGTALEGKNRDDRENHYLAVVYYENDYILAYVDVMTGEMKVTTISDEDTLITELSSIDVHELVYHTPLPDLLVKRLNQQFSYVFSQQGKFEDTSSLANLVNNVCDDLQLKAVQLLLSYILRTQKRELIHLQAVQVYEVNHYLKLDYNAKYNLELTEATRTKAKKGSLLWLLDKTKTAMGGRLLRSWLEKPLISPKAIAKRHQKVENFMHHYFERLDLVQGLKSVYDLERLVARVSFGSANARDLIHLKESLLQVPLLKNLLSMMNVNGEWDDNLENMPELNEIVYLIHQSIDENAPINLSEGGIIKTGYHDTLDKYRHAMTNGKQWIAELQQKEREKTGIKTLKIGYNRVFGYYIEITKGQLHLLEEGQYERKQTLTNAERFITPELKEQERLILEAEEKSTQLEYELFVAVRENIKTYSRELQKLAKQVASLDVLQSFAQVSEDYHYVKPELNEHNTDIQIEYGRHPVVEHIIGNDKYVANDLRMLGNNRLILITGPNMSGKSTYMRQVALSVIMCQMGCFVPANKAKLPVFDRIFTRIGAADDLISGQSTFMVEMLETNQALRHATDKSLLLFDEIGRGTATYDGMALAEAILRYVHKHVKAKALFSTHYHELTRLDEELNGMKNVHVGAVEQEGQLIFLHQIQEGPADKSYGLHVAQLAGLPKSLIDEAGYILKNLESGKHVTKELHANAEQLSLFDEEIVPTSNHVPNNHMLANHSKLSETLTHESMQSYTELLTQIKEIDINHLTPFEVTQKLYALQQRYK